jgi:endonuclease/exonuclease/phosphatase family metal-dependent hydrolase
MSYNIEHMNSMFENNAVKQNERQRAQQIASVIQDINPHVLGICEAANAAQEHQHFIDEFMQGSGYQLAHGVSRGRQNLVIYYRNPFAVVSVDDAIDFYDPWNADLEQDGLKERHKWERKPLEVLFEIGQGGPRVRVILVHAKSKGVFSVVDLHNFQKIALANRKRLVGQANKLRGRLDQLLDAPNPSAVVVMGDMNDGPGLDPFEMMVGKSFVETVMGSVYDPGKIFHNSLWWMSGDSQQRKNLWTADFPDPIVNHPFDYKHRVWLDHILLSPDMLQANNPVRYVTDSGAIATKDNASRAASDHFAVHCRIET